MRLAVCLVLLFSTCAVWAQDSGPDGTEPASPSAEQPADAPAEAPAPETPWKFALDVGVRTSILIPVFGSQSFDTGGSAGAELAVPLADKRWHVRAGLDTGSIEASGQQYYLTTIRPGISYDAFFGPTAFMTFEAEGGWLVATGTNFTYAAGKPCVGAGSSISFYLGSHVNFRTDLRYLEVFGTIHLLSFAVGFDVIGN